MQNLKKIHIFLDIQEGPWGGGNQFLKALRHSLRVKKYYAESCDDADIVLVNSHHLGDYVRANYLINLIRRKPEVTIIHRLDGPVSSIRNKDKNIDTLIFKFNELFSHGTIIQSQWCFDNCLQLGLKLNHPCKIIFNAPNPEVFYPASEGQTAQGQDKIRLIATSWSPNMRKGFDVYRWIDKNLDWNRYEMSFVGNSPVKFQNIKYMEPMDSLRLGECLRAHDIFITASKTDPCSNSLIEALHSGLPALALNDGGHPEIIKDGGLCFNQMEEIPEKLLQLSSHLNDFRSKINVPSMDEVVSSYLTFMQHCSNMKNYKNINDKDIDAFQVLYQQYLSKKQPKAFYVRGVRKVLKLVYTACTIVCNNKNSQ